MHFNKILITVSKATNTGIRGEDMQTANKHKKYSTSTNSHQENALLFCFLLLFIFKLKQTGQNYNKYSCKSSVR